MHDRPRQRTDPNDSWRLVVRNDPINTQSYVRWVLMREFGLSTEQASDAIVTIEREGAAVVSWSSITEAEGAAARLHTYGLWATIEHEG